MFDSDLDDTALTLPKHILEKIDNAFDQAIAETRPESDRPSKRRRITQDDDEVMAGGFIVEDTGGGFILDSENEQDTEDIKLDEDEHPTHIPLSLIPRALQILDLSPDDADVLDVFSNASTQDELVGRKDWRSVCAIIYPSAAQSSSEQKVKEPGNVADEELSDLSPLPSDGGESGSFSDVYVPETKPTKKKKAPSGPSPKKTRKSRRATSASDNDTDAKGPRPLTSRQESDSLAAFSLFFPNTDTNELSTKVLTIKDIANAASSIKERITADEIVEMLNHFSSSPSASNPTLSYQDFQRMMVETRLT